jgi:hypothetical protein
MVMVFVHGNIWKHRFSRFSTYHPVADLTRRTDVGEICRDLWAIDARIWPALWFPRVLLVLNYPRGIVGGETGPETKGSTFPGQSDVSDQNAGRRDNLQTSAGTRRFLSVCLPFSAIIPLWASCRLGMRLNPDQYGTHLRD